MVPASQRVSCLDVVYFIILNGFFFICMSLCGYVRALVGGLREQIRVSGPLEFQAVGSPSIAGAGN